MAKRGSSAPFSFRAVREPNPPHGVGGAAPRKAYDTPNRPRRTTKASGVAQQLDQHPVSFAEIHAEPSKPRPTWRAWLGLDDRTAA